MGSYMLHYIRELRDSTKLTQKDFAEKYGIPLSTLRKWEQGESIPPSYVVRLIENTLPCFKEQYLTYLGNNGGIYYLDKENKRVGDSLGNWIYFEENIEGVIDDNIGIYIGRLFEAYYEAQKRFNEDLKFDKVNKINWR